ncbi:PAS domain-containing protein [Mucilaginibacter sp.]
MLYSDHAFTDTQLLDIIALSPAATAIYSGDDIVIRFANEAMLGFWGRDKSIIGLPLATAVPELQEQQFINLLQGVWHSGETYQAKGVAARLLVDHQLSTYYFDFKYEPLKNAEGAVWCILHTAKDVTAEVNSRHALQQHDERLQRVVNEIPVAIGLLTGEDMVIEMANEPLLQMWQKTAGEVFHKPFFEVFTNPYQQDYPQLLKQVMATGQAYHNAEATVYVHTATGPQKYVLSLAYTPFTDSDGKVTAILLTAIDITDKVENRNSVNLATEQFKLAIDSAELGTWTFHSESRVLIPSGRFKELYGYYAYEEMPDNAALDQIAPDYRDKVWAAMNAAFKNNEDFKIDFPIQRVHDNRTVWLRATGKQYQDSNGKTEHMSGVIIDITDQKEQIAQQNDFIAMASHELKTPVTSIKGLAQVAELMLRKEGNFKMADMLFKLQGQVGRLVTLIGDLLDITKLQAGTLQFNEEYFDFNAMVADTAEEMQRTTHKHDLICNLNFHGQVFGDKERIRQVIINFISNAIKYSPDADTVIINTSVNSGFAELWVKDFGIGIERRHLQRVFDQFYRVTGSSEKKFKGLGLGLYISSTIIQRSGGKIWADSVVGNGSTFCFSLPVK